MHINYEIMIRMKKVNYQCISISHHDLIEMASPSGKLPRKKAKENKNNVQARIKLAANTQNIYE